MNHQEQAEKIIIDTELIEKLTIFGETHVVGSVAFGTTIKPDIDIQIYTSGHYEDVAKDITELLTNLDFTEIHGRRLRKSKKYLILAKKEFGDTVWDVDITLTQPSKDYIKDSYQFYLDYSPKISDEKRKLIKQFKTEFNNVKIMGDNSAFYIYNGVLDENITTSTKMTEYLNKRK